MIPVPRLNRSCRCCGVAVVLAMWVVTGAVADELPAAEDVCGPEKVKDLVDFEIDLAKGEVEGRYRYKSTEKVRIVVKNKNPFLYDYKITVDMQPVPEPALDYALRNLFPLNIAMEEKVPEEKIPEATKSGEVVISMVCEEEIRTEKERTGIDFKHEQLGDQWDELLKELEDLQRLVDDLVRKTTSHDTALRQEHQTCEELVEKAQAAYDGLDYAPLSSDIENVVALIEEFKCAIGAQQFLLSVFEANLSDECNSAEIRTASREYANALKLYTLNVTKAEEQIRKAEKSKAALDEMRKSIEQALQPGAFYWTRTVGDYDKPMIVTVNVQRKKKTIKDFPDDTFISEKLRFGGRARFSLGVGVAFAGLEKPEYESIQGVAFDPEGNVITDTAGDPVVTRVVGQTDDSGGRIAPMVTLNTRFAETGPVSHHITLGVTVNDDNAGRDVEYLVGYSMSIAEERFFITFGAYNGRVQELQQGFYVGQPLPEEMGAVPVRKSREWGAAIGFTWKFK